MSVLIIKIVSGGVAVLHAHPVLVQCDPVSSRKGVCDRRRLRRVCVLFGWSTAPSRDLSTAPSRDGSAAPSRVGSAAPSRGGSAAPSRGGVAMS